MSLISQVLAVTATNLRNIPQRLGSSLVIVIGMAGVVAVLIPIFAMSMSFRETIKGDGRADRAIVLRRTATSEYESSLTRQSVATLMNAEQVRRDARGRPMISPEVVLVAPVARKRDQSDVNATLRGVGEQYFAMRPELKLISGRLFHPGKQELVVGAAAQSQFSGLEVGDLIRLQGGDWTVVGLFAGGNGSRESEVIADVQTVMSVYALNTFHTMTVTLNSADSLGAFNETVSRETKSLVEARSEPEYLASASTSVNRMLHWVAYTIGSIMALGALFGALNSMYSAISARAGEMATLRAMGFASSAVGIAVMIEALLLALLGAGVGAGIACAAFDGTTISTLGGALFDSQLVYSLAITPSLVAAVMALACVLGLAGGLMPAVRVARASITEALRET